MSSVWLAPLEIAAFRFFGRRRAGQPSAKKIAKTYKKALRGFNKGRYEKAIRRLQWLALWGHPGAQHTIGYAYLTGAGLPRDPVAAVDWFYVSAAAGFAESQFALALSYKQGEGSPRNEERYLEWIKKAAANGHAGAARYLDAAELGCDPTPYIETRPQGPYWRDYFLSDATAIGSK